MMEALFAKHFAALTTDLDQLLSSHGYDQLLVCSGAQKMQFRDDLPYPFRANPYFKMIVPGMAHPYCWVIWRVGRKPVLVLYQAEDFWHAVPALPQGFWVDYFDVQVMKQADEARLHFGEIETCAFLGEIDDLIVDWHLGRRNPAQLVAAIDWQRSYKSPYEQACILKANRISSGGHQAAKTAFYAGACELEISLEFQRGCQQDEFRLAYPPVVGMNEHACILHYFHRDTISLNAAKRRSLLIDAGADHMGYASDITRTYSFRDDEFGQLILALDAGQQQLVQDLRPGQNYLDANTRSKHLCGTLLREFGIVNTPPESTVETGLVDYFYPHGIGHFLGLQVHDVAGNYAGPSGAVLPPHPAHTNMRLLRTVETNHVFTVEPGIYFIPMLLAKLARSDLKNAVNWLKVEQLLPFGGVRIEDNILMTGAGAVNLTRRAFADGTDELTWQ